GGPNLYAAFDGDPINNSDPAGTSPKSCALGVAEACVNLAIGGMETSLQVFAGPLVQVPRHSVSFATGDFALNTQVQSFGDQFSVEAFKNASIVFPIGRMAGRV